MPEEEISLDNPEDEIPSDIDIEPTYYEDPDDYTIFDAEPSEIVSSSS